MFDRDSLIISYDTKRGEPRGSRRRDADPKQASLGDCIDCQMCVQVCPTGIDIRNGLQYECIACAACIDACDSVMDKMQYPRGLVRYTTQHALDGGKTRILRPRILVYGTLLALLSAGLLVALAARTPIELDVIRDRNALYRESRPGYVENVFTLRVINKDTIDHEYSLSVTGLPTLTLDSESTVAVPAGELFPWPMRVVIEDGVVDGGGHDIEFTLTATDDPAITTTERGRFFTP
jgi:cytochrome c oxidase accessory protein FixG